MSVQLRYTNAQSYANWARTRGSTLIIPVGAFEQHGPHLPMGTDEILATEMAEGVAERMDHLNARVAAAVNYGYKSQQKSGGGNHLPGTISLDAATLIGLTRNVVGAYLDQGVQNVVLLNGHYENYQFLYEGVDLALSERGIEPGDRQAVLLLSYWDYVSDVTLIEVYPDGFPGWDIEHGGVLETALMLHLFPELVDMGHAVDHEAADMPKFDRLPVVPERTPSTGCLSAPTGADASKGRLLYEQTAESIAADLQRELG